VRAGDEPWPLTPLEVQPIVRFDPLLDRERIREIRLSFALPHRTGDYQLTVRQNLFAQMEPFHTHVFQVDYGKGVASLPMAAEQELTVPVEDPSREGFWIRTITCFEDGARRLADRPQFLLFLLVAMLGFRRVPLLLAAAGAGALGATVTYALAASRVLAPSERATTLAMAFSVVYLAAENLLSKDRRHRWITTFLFGLVHGLALATLLFARGVPFRGRTAAIVAFQGGLLTGVVLFVVVTVPLLLWLAGPTRRRRFTLRGLNAVALVAGVSLAFL
jgi:hypothetical protein